MSSPSRVAKGVSTGGQFAQDPRPEDGAVSLGASPEKPAMPETLSDSMKLLHKTYIEGGVGQDKATGVIVGSAASQLGQQYQDHLKRAAAEGSGELTLAYLESEKAVSKVLRSAVENMEDSEALRKDVRDARRSLGSGPASMFKSFGPNNISSTLGETDRFLGEIETFMDHVKQE